MNLSRINGVFCVGKGAMAEVSTIVDSIISNCTVCRW